jgi:hypothetical protein
MMGTDLGQRFAEALGHRDNAALKSLLADNVDFRAMTPGKFWETSNASGVVEGILLGTWFEPQDRVTSIEHIETGAVGARQRVRYQFALTNPEGDFLVEQQMYFDVDNRSERISWLRIICSGFQPLPSRH